MGIFKAICSIFGKKSGEILAGGTGVVKWFSNTKGYGFIQPEDGSQDVFVHISAVQNSGLYTLNKDQRIAYDLESKRGRVSAVNLRNPGR